MNKIDKSLEKYKLKTGRLTPQEAKIFRDAYREALKDVSSLDRSEFVERGLFNDFFFKRAIEGFMEIEDIHLK